MIAVSLNVYYELENSGIRVAFVYMVNRIYPSELQLNKANVSDAEASFLDLHLSISDGFVKTKIYDKRDDFDFDIVNFPFLVRRWRPPYGGGVRLIKPAKLYICTQTHYKQTGTDVRRRMCAAMVPYR